MATNDFCYAPELNDKILELYSEGASSTQVAVGLNMTRTQFVAMRKAVPEFNEICEFGENTAQSFLEGIALDGAQGKIKNFNNTILQFLLKSQYPETYNDKKADQDDGGSLLEKLTAGSLKIVRENE